MAFSNSILAASVVNFNVTTSLVYRGVELANLLDSSTSFFGVQTGSVSVTNNTWTAYPVSMEIDTDGGYNGSGYVIPKDGNYQIKASIPWYADSRGGRSTGILTTAGFVSGGVGSGTANSNLETTVESPTVIKHLVAGTAVGVWAFQNTGVTIVTYPDLYRAGTLSIVKV